MTSYKFASSSHCAENVKTLSADILRTTHQISMEISPDCLEKAPFYKYNKT